jgi:hypothetical protein
LEKYPQLIRGPGAGPALDWENEALLLVLQASQGLMAPEIDAVSVQALPDSIVIHACHREASDAVAEDLNDLVGEVEALLIGITGPMVDIRVSVHVGATDAGWPGYRYRRRFLIHPRVRDQPGGLVVCGAGTAHGLNSGPPA